MKKISSQLGFTLTELLVTVTIAAILLSIGVPSFTDLVRNTRLSSTMNQLISDLYAAKGEAIKRNARVLVCAKSASANTCNNVTNWANGWMVCFDVNADGACDTSTAADPNPLIIRNAIPASLTLNGPGTPVQFTSTGAAQAAVNFALTGTWSGSPTKTGAVALTGAIRSY